MGDLICKIVKDSSGSFFVANDGCDFELVESSVVVRVNAENNIMNIFDLAAHDAHRKILENSEYKNKKSHLVCLGYEKARLLLSPNDHPFHVKCPICRAQYTFDNKMFNDTR